MFTVLLNKCLNVYQGNKYLRSLFTSMKKISLGCQSLVLLCMSHQLIDLYKHGIEHSVILIKTKKNPTDNNSLVITIIKLLAPMGG